MEDAERALSTIHEIEFEKGHNFSWHQQKDNHWISKFKTPTGLDYHVHFKQINPTHDHWEVSFKPKGGSTADNLPAHHENGFHVMNNVVGSIKSFIKDKNPKAIYFTPTDWRRHNAYRRIVQRRLPDTHSVSYNDETAVIRPKNIS